MSVQVAVTAHDVGEAHCCGDLLGLLDLLQVIDDRPVQSAPLSRGLSVVVASLEDHDVVTVDEIHEPMLLVDSSRPRTGEGVTKLFWFADASEGIAGDVVEEAVDALERGTIGALPVPIVVPPVGGEDEPHRSSSCSSELPARAWSRLSSKRRTLAGDRSK